jgi:hemoglobin-like flavoprotein
MSPEQVALVKQTWRKVEPMSDAAAELFYHRLFEIDATAWPLFRQVDLGEQKRKLVAALATVVQGLDDPQAVGPVVSALGRRHARYGVRDSHFEAVGKALLWTLARGLGSDWTPAAEAAWTQAYAIVADAMRSALAEPDAAQAPSSQVSAGTRARR